MKRKHTAKEVDELEDRYILVAFDYGTTFSGAAWAQTARPEVQTAILQWPNDEGSLEGQTSEKVPTELCNDGQDWKWGFEIPDNQPRHQWFKLGLDPNHKNQELSLLAIDHPDEKALPPAYGNEPNEVRLTTEYLTKLRSHTIRMLRRKLGNALVDTTKVRFTITVPAIWDDAAKARTQQCATDAGMGREISIISEPEAAVIYALDAMDPHSLNVGDCFVLCDAGGGTVDLISYSIVSKTPTVQVRETVIGTGGACGSIFLNRIFKRYLEENLGDMDGFGDDTLEDALAEFESTLKRKFTGDEEKVVIRVPGLADDPAKGVRRQKLTIKGTVLKDLFKPVMTAITILIKGQLQQCKDAKAVILVGGFGQSPYLRKCIGKVIGGNIEIMQPAYGWTAVVRGALIKSLHDAAPGAARIGITTRRARRAYGLEVGRPYLAAKHRGLHKWYHGYSGKWMVTEMKWFINKGDELDQTAPLDTSWYHSRKVSRGFLVNEEIGLYAFTPHGDEDPPAYPCADVKDLVTLQADLSAIAATEIPVEVGKDGKDYYVLAYQIKVAFFSAHMEYSLWYKDVEYGKVKAEYA
ncbi:hypothetical protein LTR10_021470 [Elasticomyces elasticus]|uniref:Actin-like ATPase domain-containing protein n=1 Tax=Exophiala sideris TaxID=1016849 RepID=A0ABR0J944_9EURO|nr:hypothetical protein LTR10_021470 [Elasticomyces elasticus]KAK5027824.1 hypothetical protein LTS07_006699 [Exophiala sideris]KAK5037588.1 hypothetical protein LTR13_004746 [Exophiala sideris]KAK5059249.1 hypothetical protein LTR69_006539 [Exophiala sideris]KAK5183083.1 hypothetical protein LTR44_004794 [Eurotiomycetes sp. CCFEE 6388]